MEEEHVLCRTGNAGCFGSGDKCVGLVLLVRLMIAGWVYHFILLLLFHLYALVFDNVDVGGATTCCIKTAVTVHAMGVDVQQTQQQPHAHHVHK